MPRSGRDNEETGRGEEVYERSVREKVEGEAGGRNEGRFVVLDVETGDYELADEAVVATARLRERRPDSSSTSSVWAAGPHSGCAVGPSPRWRCVEP